MYFPLSLEPVFGPRTESDTSWPRSRRADNWYAIL